MGCLAPVTVITSMGLPPWSLLPLHSVLGSTHGTHQSPGCGTASTFTASAAMEGRESPVCVGNDGLALGFGEHNSTTGRKMLQVQMCP